MVRRGWRILLVKEFIFVTRPWWEPTSLDPCLGKWAML